MINIILLFQKLINTPSQESEAKILTEFNKGAQTQIRKKMEKRIYQNQTYNTINKEYLRKEIDMDEWPSIEKGQKSIIYTRNMDIQKGGKEIKTDSNDTENQNQNINLNLNINQNESQNFYQNQIQNGKYPSGMVYNRRTIPDLKPSYSKSNYSEISEDIFNQYKRQLQNENENRNYFKAGNASELASPYEYNNTNENIN